MEQRTYTKFYGGIVAGLVLALLGDLFFDTSLCARPGGRASHGAAHTHGSSHRALRGRSSAHRGSHKSSVRRSASHHGSRKASSHSKPMSHSALGKRAQSHATSKKSTVKSSASKQSAHNKKSSISKSSKSVSKSVRSSSYTSFRSRCNSSFSRGCSGRFISPAFAFGCGFGCGFGIGFGLGGFCGIGLYPGCYFGGFAPVFGFGVGFGIGFSCLAPGAGIWVGPTIGGVACGYLPFAGCWVCPNIAIAGGPCTLRYWPTAGVSCYYAPKTALGTAVVLENENTDGAVWYRTYSVKRNGDRLEQLGTPQVIDKSTTIKLSISAAVAGSDRIIVVAPEKNALGDALSLKKIEKSGLTTIQVDVPESAETENIDEGRQAGPVAPLTEEALSGDDQALIDEVKEASMEVDGKEEALQAAKLKLKHAEQQIIKADISKEKPQEK